MVLVVKEASRKEEFKNKILFSLVFSWIVISFLSPLWFTKNVAKRFVNRYVLKLLEVGNFQ